MELDKIEPYQDHWRADYCIYPKAVPGVSFFNQDLKNFSQPSYLDIPELEIGSAMNHNNVPSPPEYAGVDNYD